MILMAIYNIKDGKQVEKSKQVVSLEFKSVIKLIHRLKRDYENFTYDRDYRCLHASDGSFENGIYIQF